MPEKICAHIRAIATVSDVQLGVDLVERTIIS
jgi:hypothetical protein